MTKKELINSIIDNLRNSDGSYIAFPIDAIIPVKYIINPRLYVSGTHLSVKEYNDEPVLVLAQDNQCSCYWKCPDMTKEIYEKILSAIRKSRTPKVYYVITRDEAYDYEQFFDVVLVTTDEQKALVEFEKYKKQVREYAEEKGYIFDDDTMSVECYRDGSAAQDHYYVRLYRKESGLIP